MRGLTSYLLAGILGMLVLDFVAPPAGLGLAVGAAPAVGYAPPTQIVDRTHKGDRLVLPTEVGKQQTGPLPKVVVGCDPAYSSLLTSARASTAGRCIA
ncbi:MAG TPA: hypothetical protein VFC45_02750 [Pseudolabrys sp.]|nr:hypothetical protein [Pseudolabrys sp.]